MLETDSRAAERKYWNTIIGYRLNRNATEKK